MPEVAKFSVYFESPSPRRAWIEMWTNGVVNRRAKSPSPRRAWIEINAQGVIGKYVPVALPTEGVD